MIVVHHLNNSRSQRVLWLLEELGVDYAIEIYSGRLTLTPALTDEGESAAAITPADRDPYD